MRCWVLGALLLPWFAVDVGAQQLPAAVTVSACGAQTYTANGRQPLTQDLTGDLCTSASIGSITIGTVAQGSPAAVGNAWPVTLAIGGALNAVGNPIFVSPGTGASFAVTAASLPLPTGAATAANQTAIGCAGATIANTLTKPINSAGASTSLTLVAGVSAQKVYVCSIDIITSAANNIALVEGTTTTTACDTGTAGVAGGATAATGWNFSTTSNGLAKGNGAGIVYKTATNADALCLLFSAATQVSGSITYAQF